MRVVSVALWLTVLFAMAGCGSEIDNPYDSDASLPDVSIQAAYAELHHKIVDDSLNSGMIVGSQPGLDVELWLFDAAGARVARFPMRWRITTTGVNMYAWWKTRNIIGLKGLESFTARDLLGTYSGFGSGMAAIAGQTSFKGGNGHLNMRMIVDRAGFGLEIGIEDVQVTKGSAAQDYGWDSSVQVERGEVGW